MKRLVLALLAIFALTAAGALVAQSPQNTTAPGPTQQRAPGMTSNNLPNPGNPQTNLSERDTDVDVAPETEQGEGMDLDVDVGANADDGLVDVEVNRTHDADTMAQGNDANDAVDNQAQGSTTGLTNVPDRTPGTAATDDDGMTDTATGAYGDQDTLPGTASNLPLMALIGLICLGAAYSVRTLAKRDV